MALRNVITDSEFSMWRAIFAFALSDKSFSIQEQMFLRNWLQDVRFSAAHIAILKKDFQNPKDVVDLYRKITNPVDLTHFCVLARALAWCEGDMDKQEEEILKRVSCISDKSGQVAMARSRRHPFLKKCYEAYAKAGFNELFSNRHLLQLSI